MGRTWMLYGATGYTGQLMARHAVERGHRPLLAGRTRAKLEPLAEELGLPFRVLPLDDPKPLAEAVRGVDLVLNAAGPMRQTSHVLREACLAGGAHFLDITGEVEVMREGFAADARARHQGVAVMSGVGFDVMPTDCLAMSLQALLPDAVRLELAVAADGLPSAGTARTMLGMLQGGSLERRNGSLEPVGFTTRRVPFSSGPRDAVSLPWGDLVTAYHSTCIPNIRTWVALQGNSARLVALTAPLLRPLLGSASVRAVLSGCAGRLLQGPAPHAREQDRWQVWGRVENARGQAQEGWLTTAEGYWFTSRSAVYCVEQTLARCPVGAQTPAAAFGADAVLSIPRTTRQLAAGTGVEALPRPRTAPAPAEAARAA